MKKVLLAFFVIATVLMGSAYAITLDVPEVVYDADENAEAVLSATLIPGLNIFTGTTAVKNFEDSTHSFRVADASNTRGVVDNATEKADTGRQMKRPGYGILTARFLL